MSKEFKMGILAGFILVVIIFFALLISIPRPIIPRSLEQECFYLFAMWCHECLAYKWPNDVNIPSEVLCIEEYNPLNMPLPKDKTCNSMKYLCEEFGVK